MPRGDQTGPMGQGCGTGRAAGYCSGAGGPGFSTMRGQGARPGGIGRGRMSGRGGRGGVWCRGMGDFGRPTAMDAPATADAQQQALLAVQANLDALSDRLARLEKQADRD